MVLVGNDTSQGVSSVSIADMRQQKKFSALSIPSGNA
jgi:hypothetical protein